MKIIKNKLIVLIAIVALLFQSIAPLASYATEVDDTTENTVVTEENTNAEEELDTSSDLEENTNEESSDTTNTDTNELDTSDETVEEIQTDTEEDTTSTIDTFEEVEELLEEESVTATSLGATLLGAAYTGALTTATTSTLIDSSYGWGFKYISGKTTVTQSGMTNYAADFNFSAEDAAVTSSNAYSLRCTSTTLSKCQAGNVWVRYNNVRYL